MEFELSKKDKKIAREIIEKGKKNEFESGMQQFEEIIKRGKDQNLSAQECYYELFNAVKSYDKKIALRYDRMSGSNYLYIIAGQLFDKFISKEDLSAFTEEIQNKIIWLSEYEW
jgi:uncharacterized FlaG/YvyC family protein